MPSWNFISFLLLRLKYLNLAKNHIYYIPHLRVLGSAIAHVEDFKAQNKSAKSGSVRNKSQRSSAHSQVFPWAFIIGRFFDRSTYELDVNFHSALV